jgi:cyclin E
VSSSGGSDNDQTFGHPSTRHATKSNHINSKTFVIATVSNPNSSIDDEEKRDNKVECSNKLNNNVSSKLVNSKKRVEENYSSEESSSTPSENGSDDFYVAEFDLPDLESPADALSPVILESEPEWVSKGDKTPHSAGRKPLGYKTVLCEKPPCYVVPTAELRTCPLPALNWTNANDMWKIMYRKDERASLERESSMFQNHPGLQPRMRAILLDWLIEVCEVYKLHRETYYLTVDYLDRYLTARKDVSKNQLQLIGITCLFVASKVEEIYPPKLAEFAYVTDGACSEEDILQQEILVLQALNWNVSPVTIMGWLSIYMQLNVTTCKSSANSTHRQQTKSEILLNTSKYGKSFIYPQFSGFKFVKTAQLIDLCSLDIDIADFPYSVVAAAAISHTFDK